MTNQNISLTELKEQLASMVENRLELIKLYKTFPSENLQDKIIDLGKKIGTAESDIREIEFFGLLKQSKQ